MSDAEKSNIDCSHTVESKIVKPIETEISTGVARDRAKEEILVKGYKVSVPKMNKFWKYSVSLETIDIILYCVLEIC